jgi:hypothetical protein
MHAAQLLIAAVIAGGILPGAGTGAKQGHMTSLLPRIDHLVYATPNLAATVEHLEHLLGVRATPGGQHPGRGTRNFLLSLGPTAYLEIIGPDPEQPAPAFPRTFGIDDLREARLVTWAAHERDLERVAKDAADHGIQLGPLSDGSRKRPDGVLLKWRYTSPQTLVADGIVPFFIDWGTSEHPARSAAKGATLMSLRAEHPDAERVQQMLRQLGLDLAVTRGPRPALIATLQSPRGRIELR